MGKPNRYNPKERKDNCVACVAACLLDKITGTFRTADQLDSKFNITASVKHSPDPQSAISRSVDLVESATGLQVVQSIFGRDLRDPREHRTLAQGHYAVFLLGANISRVPSSLVTYHVIYGRVDPGPMSALMPMKHLHDPQSDAQRGYGDLVPPCWAVLFDVPAKAKIRR